MNILILGSEGFIGRHLIEYYLAKGEVVVGADILESATQAYRYFKISRLSPEYEELLINNEFDYCINAAGSGSVPYSMTHPIGDFESNALDTIRLLDGIRRYQPTCRYLHISSAAVYGNPVQLPVSEEAVLKPLSPYGWHKLVAEQICREYTTVFGIQTIIVRPFSVYGPGLKKQIFWDLFQKTRSAKPGAIIELWGTGEETRDFIYINDLIIAIDTLLTKAHGVADVYNIGSGLENSISSVATLLCSHLNHPYKLVFNQKTKEGDPVNWCADISRLEKLGFNISFKIEQGLEFVGKWMSKLP